MSVMAWSVPLIRVLWRMHRRSNLYGNDTGCCTCVAGAVSGVFSFSGVEHFRTQNMQNVWRESVTFSPGLLKSSIEYEVNTHYAHIVPQPRFWSLRPEVAAPMLWSWYDLLF